MSRRELSSFRWDGERWTVVNRSSQSARDWNKQNAGETIRVATLNILADCFPWFIEMAIRSSERYEWLCTGLTNLNATIIGLMEVTSTALQQLQQCLFIRENYYITESFDEGKNVNNLLRPHGCILLSKLPLLEVFAISVSGSTREAVIGRVQLGDTSETSVYFCAHHTTAYQTPKNASLRAQQIGDIVSALQPHRLPFVIMGDLNLHYQFEDAVIIENKLIDAWAQTHFSRCHPFNDGNEGYTFDAVKNTLIPYYIPGECRQMRLDRILFSNGFPAFAIAPCTLWADQPIHQNQYLFPSDHFGLFVDIVFNISGDNREGMPLSESDPSTAEILRRNAQNNADQRAYRLGIVRTTASFTTHLLWLGAIALGFK